MFATKNWLLLNNKKKRSRLSRALFTNATFPWTSRCINLPAERERTTSRRCSRSAAELQLERRRHDGVLEMKGCAEELPTLQLSHLHAAPCRLVCFSHAGWFLTATADLWHQSCGQSRARANPQKHVNGFHGAAVVYLFFKFFFSLLDKSGAFQYVSGVSSQSQGETW